MARYLLWILIALLAFVGGSNPYIPVSEFAVIYFFVFATLSFLLLTIFGLRHPENELSCFSKLNVALILFFTWAVLGYFYTVRIEYSFSTVTLSLGVILFIFALLAYLKTIKQLDEIFWILTVCAGINVLFALLQQIQPGLLGLSGSIYGISSHSSFRHVNLFCGYLLFHIPIAMSLFFSEKSQELKVIAAFFFVLLLIGVGVSGSPGGQAVVFLQLLLMSGYFFWKKQFSGLKLVGAGILSALIFCILFTQILKSYFWTAGDMGDANALLSLTRRSWSLDHILARVVFWQSAWEIFKDHWLTGSGPNTFPLLYFRYFMKAWVPVDFIELEPPDGPVHAHNLYLQTASDTGVVGLGLLLVCLYFFYSTSITIISKREQPEIVFYLTLGLTCYLIHNLIEFNWTSPVFKYYFVLWVIIVDFIRRNEIHRLGMKRPVFLALTAGYATIAIIVATCFYLFTQEIQHMLKSKTLEEVETHSYLAEQFCPKCNLPGNIMATVFNNLYRQTGNPELLSNAEIQIQVSSQGYNFDGLIYLAEIRTLQNRFQEARKIYSQVIRFGTQRHVNIALEKLNDIKNLGKE